MIFKILKKDIKVLLSDKKSLFIFILMPIVLTTILSFSLKESFGDSGKFDPVNVGIVKEYDAEEEIKYFSEKIFEISKNYDVNIKDFDIKSDNLNPEKIFFEDFLESNEVKEIVNSKVMTDKEAETAMLNDEIVAVVYLPKNFIYDQLINFTMPYRNEIDIRISTNADFQYSAQIAEMVFQSYFNKVNQKLIEKNVFIEIGSEYTSTADVFESLSEVMGLSELERRDGTESLQRLTIPGERKIDSSTYYGIAMMGMFILYVSGYVGKELLREKKLLTLNRGTVAGITYSKVLASKFLSTFILCFIQMTVLLLYSAIVLKVAWNRPLAMAIGIVFSALAVSGLGVFLSAITLAQNNFKVANIFENILIHIFALIGGSYIPIEALPDIIVRLKIFALNGVVLDLFLGIYKGSSISDLLPYMVALTVISLVFSGLALLIVKRKEVSTYYG